MNPASLFFSALFGRYPNDETLRLEIRCLPPAYDPDRPKPFPRQWYCLAPSYIDNAAAACEHWARDWDVYCGVLPRVGRSGSQNDVLWANWLFCDVDGGNEGVDGAVRRVKNAGIDRPDIAIQSGGGAHCYWELDYPTALPDRDSRESFKRTLRRLCLAIGGAAPEAHADTSACEVARILRVPGTFNHKQGADALRPVRSLRHAPHVSDAPPFSGAVGFSSFSRSYDWWRARLPIEPAAHRPRALAPSAPYTPLGLISPGLEAWAKKGYPEGKRHQDFAGAAAWLVRDVKLNKADAAALLRIKAANSPGRRVITPEEIEGVVKWA